MCWYISYYFMVALAYVSDVSASTGKITRTFLLTPKIALRRIVEKDLCRKSRTRCTLKANLVTFNHRRTDLKLSAIKINCCSLKMDSWTLLGTRVHLKSQVKLSYTMHMRVLFTNAGKNYRTWLLLLCSSLARDRSDSKWYISVTSGLTAPYPNSSAFIEFENVSFPSCKPFPRDEK